jgi:hypothetical protein
VYYNTLVFFVKTIVGNPDDNHMILYLKKTLTLQDSKKYN